MKKLILTLSLISVTCLAAWAQAPNQLNYQGVARTSAGTPISSATISLRLSVYDGSATGTLVYQETHVGIATNTFGLYNVAIGGPGGTVTSGSWAGINWSTGNKYLEVELDPTGGTSYTVLGTNELLSSPYALYANNAGTVSLGGDVTGTNTAATVAKIQGNAVSAAAPVTGQGLVWNGSAWTPSAISGSGTVVSVTAGTGLSGGTITSSGTISLPNVGTAGTYGSATTIPVVTTDAQGRVTGVSTVSATGGSSSVSGTANYIPKFTSGTAVGNSIIYQSPTVNQVGVNVTAPNATLDVESTTDTIVGLFATNTSSNVNYGVVDGEYDGSGTAAGVRGWALANPGNNNTFGVEGVGNEVGAIGFGENTVVTGSSYARGLEGDSYSDDYSEGIAGFASPYAGSPSIAIGVLGNASGGATNYSGYFVGDIYVGGTVYATTKSFKIDHPTDPDNKYLVHACVESDEMTNIYSGNVTTDATGTATVTLPSYFEALNKDCRYQLTAIGTFAQAIVSREVSGNTFEVKTSIPNVKVSWQVTGVRQDAWANAHPMQTEVEKESFNKGKYLHAKELNKPANKQIGTDFAQARPKEAAGKSAVSKKVSSDK